MERLVGEIRSHLSLGMWILNVAEVRRSLSHGDLVVLVEQLKLATGRAEDALASLEGKGQDGSSPAGGR